MVKRLGTHPAVSINRGYRSFAAVVTGRGVLFFTAAVNAAAVNSTKALPIASGMEQQKTVYLTEEGLENLKKELRFLKVQERARIAKAIQEAREKGDLSENAEYDAAKEAQGHLEARIARMEETISNARLVDEKQVDASKVYILSNVRVKNHKTGGEQTFQLVSAQEADVAAGKISVKSPIGQALLGKEVGEKVDITVPAGKMTLEILEISR